jgi:hypothetical protein
LHGEDVWECRNSTNSLSATICFSIISVLLIGFALNPQFL